MDLEKIRVLTENLKVLEQLVARNVACYREINRVNAAIQQEIDAYVEPGVKVNLKYQADNNNIATWDDINNELLVRGTLTKVSDVLQHLRYHSMEEACKHFELSEIDVSNVLCFAARVCENAVY